MARVIVVHGWQESPDGAWYAWLKRALEEQGIDVDVLKMPHTERPVIDEWVCFLADHVGNIVTEGVYFVGHSIGNQTILRYLARLDPARRVAGVVMVAPWVNLLPAAFDEPEAEKIAAPWLQTSIDWDSVRRHTDHIVAVFSDDDRYVPLSDADVFRTQLNAKIVIERNQGHLGSEDHVSRLPVVFDELMRLIKK